MALLKTKQYNADPEFDKVRGSSTQKTNKSFEKAPGLGEIFGLFKKSTPKSAAKRNKRKKSI